MSTTISGTNTSIPTSITIPSNGDDVDAASVNAAFGGLADRTAYLTAQTYGVAVDDLLPVPLTPIVNASARFEFSTSAFPETGSGAVGGWTQVSVADKGVLAFALDNLPKRGKITDILATIKPAGGHGALPSGKPAIQLWAQDAGDPGAAATRIATRNDSSADVTAYELSHTIHMTGITETFENQSQPRYYIVFYGEDSTNAVTGLTLVDISIYCAPEV